MSNTSSNETFPPYQGQDPPTGTQGSSPQQRLACDICRGRKVRCDKKYPACGRCIRLRHSCRYSPPKAGHSKTEMAHALMSLHNRLAEAEAQLALSSPMLSLNQFDVTCPDFGDASIMPDQGVMGMPLQELQTHTLGDTMEMNNVYGWSPNTSDLQFSGMGPASWSDVLSEPLLSTEHKTDNTDQIWHDYSSLSYSNTKDKIASIASKNLSELHTKFFTIFDPIMPIIDQSRFKAELEHVSNKLEVQALSHAIGALAALTNPGNPKVSESCYEEARELLDKCERHKNGESLINLDALQTCVLLTLYELTQTNFARAWMSLGRAIRLAQMMGLDRMDDHCTKTEYPGLRVPLPPTSSFAEKEERRRTFWLLFVLDTFAGIKINGLPALDETQICVSLPCPGELSDNVDESNMPSLSQISQIPDNTRLSSFAGTIIMISLYRRCFHHIESSFREAVPYPFWDTHFLIEKLIKKGRSCLLMQHTVGKTPEDPLSSTTRMNLAAVEICLHEAAIAKVERDQLPDLLSSEAVSGCLNASGEILSSLQIGHLLSGQPSDSFRQSWPFMVWPITMAIQVYMRMIAQEEADIHKHIESLRILSKSMRELVDPEHIPRKLLDKADYRVAEFDHSKNEGQISGLGGARALNEQEMKLCKLSFRLPYDKA